MKLFHQQFSSTILFVFSHGCLNVLAGAIVIISLLLEPSQSGGFLGYSTGRWFLLLANFIVLASILFFIYKVWTGRTRKLEVWFSSGGHLFQLFFLATILFGFSLPAGMGMIPSIRDFDYFGRIQPTLLWLALASGAVVLNLLVVLRKPISQWFRQFFPFEKPKQPVSKLAIAQRYILLGFVLLYFLLQLASHLQVREAIWLPDSIDYIFPAETYAWNELGLWTHTKPWGAAVLYKMVRSSSVRIDAAQTILSALAWLALAWSFSRDIRANWLRVTAFGIILGFSLAPSVQMWNHIIQSESLSITLMVLIFAVWLSLLQHWRWGKLFALLLLFGWWIGTRETNVYLSLMIAGIIILVGLFYTQQRFYWAVSTILVIFCVINLQISEIPTIPRWLYPLTNTLLNRILPNEEFLAYFKAHGLETPPELMSLSGGMAISGDFAVFNDPALNDVEDWLYRKGRNTYVRFLLDHPVYTLTSPWLNIQELLPPTDILGFTPTSLTSSLSRLLGNLLFVNSLWILALFALGTTFLVLKAAPWKSSTFWVLLFSFVLVFPHLYIVWHGDAAEVGRHAIQASVQLRLTLWLMILLSLDKILGNDHRIRTRHRS